MLFLSSIFVVRRIYILIDLNKTDIFARTRRANMFKCKKLIALTFVPLGDVTTALELIADQFDEDADDLLGYFEKTWIGEPKRRGMFLFLLLNNFKRIQYS